MTLLEIYTQVLNKLRMESGDMEPNIEAQLKHAINEAYKLVAGKYKQIQVDYLPVVQGVVELPKNVLGTIEFDPNLEPSLDRIIGDNISTRRPDGTIFTLKYFATPTPLVNNTDEPLLPTRLVEALIVYPCYIYFLSKKRLDMASAYKNQFDEIMLGGSVEHDSMNESIVSIYYSFFI